MKNAATKIIAALIFIMIAALGLFAQKAEPNEIKFARGKSSATITEKLKADEEAEFVIHGKAGQILTLTFSSTIGKLAEVFVSSPSTSGETTSGNKTWEVEFGSEGELGINVTCSKNCSYTLKTTIK